MQQEQSPDNPFKLYDIRGIYPDVVDEDLARRVGSAFVEWLREVCDTDDVTLVVGHDMRASSPALHAALMEGIAHVGGAVVDGDMVPTPVLSHAAVTGPVHGGVMISASHNPPEYNALKLIFHDGRELWGEWGFPDIADRVAQATFENQSAPRPRREDLLQHYTRILAGGFEGGPRDLTVIADYGNGMGAVSARPVLEACAVHAKHTFDAPDGSFPHHTPNPAVEENMTSLQEAVRRHAGVAVGAFFDGDADRLRMVDEDGTIIDPDRLACALAYHRRNRFTQDEQRVYLDVRTSRAARGRLEEAGITVERVGVGRVRYKPLLLDSGGILAGELSGHTMFPEHFAIDDGLYTLLRVLEMMRATEMTLKDIMEPFSAGWTRTPEINMSPTRPFKEVAEMLRTTFSDGSSIDIDGVTIEWEDRWFNVRPSNTEPLVRIVVEAVTEDIRDQLLTRVKSIVSS